MKMAQPARQPGGEIILYQTEDKQTRLQVQLDGETVWLSQAQMAELFQTTKQNVSLHIQNIFKEGELRREGTVKESLTVQLEGGRRVSRSVDYYNLDVVISVGYRVKSLRGTHFRIWATQRLREYIIKGFALDDARLKEGKSAYFDELLARASGTSVRRKRNSGARCWTFTRRAPITIPARRRRNGSSPPCKTRCIGARTGRRRRKSSTPAPKKLWI
jgi:hypothetical protein